MSKFTILKSCTQEKLDELIYKRNKAVLLRVALYNVRLKDDLIPVPYISVSKCESIYHGSYDNGRLLAAEIIGQITLTDIDYRLLRQQYDFDMEIRTVAAARYGKLPEPLRRCVLEYYQKKTELKDKKSDEEHTKEFYKLLYDKLKALLNAQYGMMAQDPVKVMTKFFSEHPEMFEEECTAPEELLEQHNKKAFLVYQWGVW